MSIKQTSHPLIRFPIPSPLTHTHIHQRHRTSNMGEEDTTSEERFAYATPQTPPSVQQIRASSEDEASRVFSTKNIVSSTRQLKVRSVTMHTSTASLLSPRRKKRPREFKSMLRRIRRLNLEHNNESPTTSNSENTAKQSPPSSPTSQDSNAE